MANNLVEYILSVDSKGAVVGLKAVETGAKKTGKEIEKTGKKAKTEGQKIAESFKKMGKRALAASAAVAAAGFAVVKFAGAVKKFTIEAVDMINDLGDIGNRSGIAADTIGALKAAFHASGQEAGAVNSVLDIVAKRFGALSRGSKRAVVAFEKYGVATRDLEGNLRSNNAILLDAMHIIENLEDTSLRSRAAVELFGVGGQQLSQALGAGNFDQFLAFVNEFGATAGPKAAKSAALVQDSISLSNIAFEGFREELVLSLDLMGLLQKSLNVTMSIFAGLHKVVTANADLLNNLAVSLVDLVSAFVNLGAAVVTETEKTKKGIAGISESLFGIFAFIGRNLAFIGEAFSFVLTQNTILLEFLFKSLARFTGLGGVFDGIISSLTRLREAAIGAFSALFDLEQTLDPTTEQGKKTADSFTEGVNKALKRFNKIVEQSKKQTRSFKSDQEDLIETTQELEESINHLAEAASVLNGVFSKLGIPRSLQFGGIKEAEEQVMKLLQGLSDLGASGTFGDIKTRQGNISLDMRAQNLAAGLAAVAPQIGAAIAITAGLIQLAEKIGSMGDSIEEIKNELTKSVQERAQVIERGLQALPTILNDVLPQILQTLADAIIFGLAKFGAENINRLITAFRQIFTREGRQERREQRQAGVLGADRVAEFVRRIGVLGNIAFEGMRAGGRIPSARSGLNFTGDNAGLALLHKNEFVVPESGQAPQSVKRAMGGMGGSVNLVINAQVVERNAVDELVRQIERRFRTFGQSTSPLFGG